ncbi:MAG TPA: multidrug ABC transporter permease [Cyanobacteria bacterium UBA11149]|nr:multidrug ABC transporter permease [Cyanobacteria bacterium UBA11367]HBK65965.1 multidrug ABC transporter permease [Cyanobacteria bacterium UBA11166]HBR76126.1 multidrug ABC transporter permease [Cyanobacteria bacterium UBA11159]HBS71102.1 multidrug ABC transporter permease [Cyanobacteria bacterium UBA11153]HBW90482.1 multidrug ABC transporter permease [Cyanobacteria bacterium UBA11149]HCA97069.1 multidrug ABC transporter permease [Cyanobacteria bacterium UBA9226]
MKRVITIAKTLIFVYYAYILEYRAEIFLWALSGSLPLIMMGVWIEASQGGQFSLAAGDFARYFLAVFIIRQFTVVWVIWDFEKEVLQGQLSHRLLQPIDPVWHHVATHISERIARIPFIVALVALFFLLYPQAFWLPSLSNLLLFCVTVVMAFALRFLMQYTYALFAFWTERASAIEQFLFLLHLFLSGMIAPLEVFPDAVREVALWTPFPYMINFPASVLIGLPVDLGRAFLVMWGWGLFFFVTNRWLWRKGLKHYSGMGA